MHRGALLARLKQLTSCVLDTNSKQILVSGDHASLCTTRVLSTTHGTPRPGHEGCHSRTGHEGCHPQNSQGTRRFSTGVRLRGVSEEGVRRSPFPDLDIKDISLPNFILDNMDQFGDSTALIDAVTDRKLSYSELKRDVIKVASALSRLGLCKGDVVTISAPNSIEWATFYLGAGATGAIVSAVNPLYTAGELGHAVSHSESKYIITVPELAPLAKEVRGQCPNLKGIITFGESDECLPFSKLLEDDGQAFPHNVPITPDQDMMALPYSSGTTGLPKGVMLTHRNIVANVQQIRAPSMLEYGPDDVLMGVLPFFHIYGQVVVLLSGLVGGSTIVTLPKFDPELFLKSTMGYKVTFLHVVPPIALFLAKHPVVSKFDLSSINTLFVGAAPIGADTMNDVITRLGNNPAFRQGYGLTEASPVTNANPSQREAIKLHTIGPTVPNTDSKIVDIDTGAPLAEGQDGELCVRGPQIMKGYFKNQEATDNTIKDDWLHTGDIGHYDEDGHVIISDRLKELIKVKGFQVAPAELEALLVTHPSIQDAAVISRPDEMAGEAPIGFVVLKPNMAATESEIQDFIKEKVAPFKQLTGGVQFRTEIPKSASGKILRRFLKDELKSQ